MLMRLLSLELKLPADSHYCLLEAKSIAYGLTLWNSTEKVCDKRKQERPALLPGCA